jgi:hypothetical protein
MSSSSGRHERIAATASTGGAGAATAGGGGGAGGRSRRPDGIRAATSADGPDPTGGASPVVGPVAVACSGGVPTGTGHADRSDSGTGGAGDDGSDGGGGTGAAGAGGDGTRGGAKGAGAGRVSVARRTSASVSFNELRSNGRIGTGPSRSSGPGSAS